MADTILVVGGGAAGLMAALELATHNRRVIVVEADDRLGGRIHTLRNDHFARPVEAGAEFVHGKLPLTLQLLREAGLEYVRVGGKMMRANAGNLSTPDDFRGGWDEVQKRLQSLDQDMTVNDFLERYFSGEKYSAIRQSVRGFAEGYDVADPADASILSLAAEWFHEREGQYRLSGGLDQLVNYLQQQCVRAGVLIHTGEVVKVIGWRKGSVELTTAGGAVFSGRQVMVTVPLGVLQDTNGAAAISFEPGIGQYLEAARGIGFGNVLKILLQFREPFWNAYAKNVGFILSSEVIPTWWTPAPDSYPLLTGWLGGPKARALESADEPALLQLAIQSVASIFNLPEAAIRELITGQYVARWHAYPFCLGAYSYSTLQSKHSLQIMNTPVDDTIFFAGEGLYNGYSPGTVEAALVSGKTTAADILRGEL